MKKDLIRKITSRKFWVAIIGLSISIMQLIKVDSSMQSDITALITALGTVFCYLFVEGMVDYEHNSK